VPRSRIRLDRGGIAEVLLSEEVGSAVHDLAETAASFADGHTVHGGDDLPVKVDDYRTDRRASGVTLAHPAGLGKEAKYGILAGAAASAGLQVTARPPE
jgi:hypothetical protein